MRWVRLVTCDTGYTGGTGVTGEVGETGETDLTYRQTYINRKGKTGISQN